MRCEASFSKEMAVQGRELTIEFGELEEKCGSLNRIRIQSS